MSSPVSLVENYYGTLRQEPSRNSSVVYDMTNEIGGLWRVDWSAWVGSGVGALDSANVFVIVRWTDPTGSLASYSNQILYIGPGAPSIQEGIPIMYQAEGTFEVEFQYANVLGSPSFGHAFTMIHPFGSY